MSDPFLEGAFTRILKQQDSSPGSCPDANEFAAWLEDRLSPNEAARFEDHASRCEPCRQAIALTLKLPDVETAAGGTVPATKTFSYRSSSLRLVFAATMVLIVGVLLFQSTRPSAVMKPRQEAARRAPQPGISGGANASMSSPNAQIAIPPAAKPDAIAAFRSSDEAGKRKQTPSGAPAENKLKRPASATAEATAIASNPIIDPSTATRNAAPGQPPASVSALNAQNQAQNQPVQQIGQTQNSLQLPMRQSGGAQQAALSDRKRSDLQSAAGMAAETLPKAAVANLKEKTEMASLDVSQAIAEAKDLLAGQSKSGEIRKVGARTFYRTANYWVDGECAAHADLQIREITREAREYKEWVAQDGQLADLKGAPVLLYSEKIIYLIR